MQLRRILAPTDLSPEGERAFVLVGELALQLGAEVHLLHVVEDLGAGASPQGSNPRAHIPGALQELERVRGLLEQRQGTFPAGVKVHSESLRAPSVPRAIVEY